MFDTGIQNPKLMWYVMTHDVSKKVVYLNVNFNLMMPTLSGR